MHRPTNTIKIYGNEAAKQLSTFSCFPTPNIYMCNHLNELHYTADAFMPVLDPKHGHIKSSENLTRAVVA